MIFSIRSNGFLVYVPRYALKGPVYLTQGKSDDQVLYLNSKLGPVFQSGVVWAEDHAVHVDTVDGAQTYRYTIIVVMAVNYPVIG